MKYYNTTNSPIATPDGDGGHYWFPAMALSEEIDQEKVDRLIKLEPSLAYLLGSVLKAEGKAGAPPLLISEPVAGSTVPPVHDIRGSGAVPYSTVELWHVEANQMVADTQADGAGNWEFAGDTPASTGPVTWQVKSDGVVLQESAPLEITVAPEAAREGAKKSAPTAPDKPVEGASPQPAGKGAGEGKAPWKGEK